MDWMPAETLPTTNEKILILSTKGDVHLATYEKWVPFFSETYMTGWVVTRNHEFQSPQRYFLRNEITHWMPLPKPPTK